MTDRVRVFQAALLRLAVVRDAFGGSPSLTSEAIRAPLLLALSPSDHVTPPGPIRTFAEATGAFGCDLERIGSLLGFFLDAAASPEPHSDSSRSSSPLPYSLIP